MNTGILAVQERLFSMQDVKYRDFQSRLTPTVDRKRMIGVRVPQLRAYAKELVGTETAALFLDTLPHSYYDEDNLHAILLEQETDFDRCVAALNRFLPHVDNWATCDMLFPKLLNAYPEKLLAQVKIWISSDHIYTARFGIGILMRCFLDDLFQSEYLKLAAQVQLQDYYVQMMVAWYFATALAKQWSATLPYIRRKKLDMWTHNQAIQKAMESKRLSPRQKTTLKKLKISARGNHNSSDGCIG